MIYRWSKLFIPTLREAPADAEAANHRLLLRAGYIRQLAPGIYSYLFLGQRSINKITASIREEMDKVGHEIHISPLQPRDIGEERGRCSKMGDNLFRLKDRKGAGLWLRVIADAAVADIARKDLRSYKQLPQIWYQIQTKFRDEERPGAGLLRLRQFVGTECYSLDVDAAGQEVSYHKHLDAYSRILDRCGLIYQLVEAHSDAAAGVRHQQFVVRTEAGEDKIVACNKCQYAANLNNANSPVERADVPPENDGEPMLVHTPGVKTIDNLAQFLNVSPKNNMKTLAYMAEENNQKMRPIVAFVRGDHQLNEAKLSRAIGGLPFRPMQAEEILEVFGSPAGFLGPIGLKVAKSDGTDFGSGVIVLVDEALNGRTNLICGANREDYHLKNVTPGKHFQPTAYVDLRMVSAGDVCPVCGEGLEVNSTVEIGHISKLGTRDMEAMGAKVLDRNGKEVVPLMGSCGIEIERILGALVEQNHDQDGFWLPPQVAPFQVIVTPISVRDEKTMAATKNVAQTLEAAGLDVIVDDRDERPGVKFKDANLVGIPYRINIGKKVTEGTLEVVDRSTREIRDASITAIAEYMRGLLRPAG